jgi:hypothetical protein
MGSPDRFDLTVTNLYSGWQVVIYEMEFLALVDLGI